MARIARSIDRGVRRRGLRDVAARAESRGYPRAGESVGGFRSGEHHRRRALLRRHRMERRPDPVLPRPASPPLHDRRCRPRGLCSLRQHDDRGRVSQRLPVDHRAPPGRLLLQSDGRRHERERGELHRPRRRCLRYQPQGAARDAREGAEPRHRHLADLPAVRLRDGGLLPGQRAGRLGELRSRSRRLSEPALQRRTPAEDLQGVPQQLQLQAVPVEPHPVAPECGLRHLRCLDRELGHGGTLHLHSLPPEPGGAQCWLGYRRCVLELRQPKFLQLLHDVVRQHPRHHGR